MTTRQLVEEYLGKYPDSANQTLAKFIHEKHPEHSIGAYRSQIQLIKEERGESSKNLTHSETVKRGLVKSRVKPEAKLSKVLIFDIETSHAPAYVFSKYQEIPDGNFLADWFMLSWSAKWLFEDEITQAKVTARESERRDDKRITKSLWKMLDEANVVIAHNLKKFDKRKAQSRFLKHGLYLPSHYQEIDTLISSRKEFYELSNRLDFLTSKFLGESKLQTPRGLWIKAQGNPFAGIKPDQEAIDQMAEYCDNDVKILEDYYLLIRPYIKSHPNLSLWEGGDIPRCKACSGTEFTQIGDYSTIVNIYEGFRCNNCGSVHRARKPEHKSNVFLR